MTKQLKPKTAILINSPEVLYLGSKNLRETYALVLKNSCLENFAEKNIPADRLIYFKQKTNVKITDALSVDFESLISKTDLTEQLLKKQIGLVVLPYRSSPKIEAWAKQHGFILAVTPYNLQVEFENKKYFDNFLKERGITSPPAITTTEQIEKLDSSSLPYVVQEANLSDYFRTKFYQSGKELFYDYRQGKINLTKSLIRDYLTGVAVGVSIFLDKSGNCFISSLRTQCFYFNRGGFPRSFLGLQWLPVDFFSKKEREETNRQLKKLADNLIEREFYGVANVDLLVNKEGAFIIECNPRLSVAMPQIFTGKDFSGHDNPWQFFINTFSGEKNQPVDRKFLPQSDFSGAVLAIEAEQHLKLKKIPPLGIYQLKQNGLKFTGSSLKDLARADSLLIYHELVKGDELKKGYDLVKIFSNIPLFDFAAGSLNPTGQIINNYFNNFFYD